MESNDLSILYQDDDLVVINKPSGILVHRTKISEDTVFVLQLLRKQLRQRLYPIHRLDRGTSGVLILGKNSDAASFVSEQMRNHHLEKEYLAIIRGFVEENGTIDYPLAAEAHLERKEAVTHFQRLQQVEIQQPVGRYATGRYSYVRIRTETGRRHQIRRHFSHLRHPVIGDKKHGDVKHNHFFREKVGVPRMLLHASHLQLLTLEGKTIRIEAPLEENFLKAMNYLGFEMEQ